MAFNSYFICATPRSGSTLLCDLLSNTKIAGQPASYYRRQSIPNWTRRLDITTPDQPASLTFEQNYLDAVKSKGTCGTNLFSLRLMWETVSELSTRMDALFPGLSSDTARFEKAFGRTCYPHLSRQDKIAQAVSRLKAEQTGLWHVAPDGTERERTAPPQVPEYDAARIAMFETESIRHDAAWNQWFEKNQIEPVRITYEALSADPSAVLKQILTILGQDPTIAENIKVGTAKMADTISNNWSARFKAEKKNSPTTT